MGAVQHIYQNYNEYKLTPVKAFNLEVKYKDGSVATYFIARNQLVSILAIVDGKMEIYRGRVQGFQGPDLDVPNNHSRKVILDCSTMGNMCLKEIFIEDIQEVNPIDWQYPDSGEILIPYPYAEWKDTPTFVIAAVTHRDRLPE